MVEQEELSADLVDPAHALVTVFPIQAGSRRSTTWSWPSATVRVTATHRDGEG